MALGKANRVAQEKGPLTILFKDFESKPLTTYYQIDGEFYRVTNPQRIEVGLSDKLGHIRILKNIDNEWYWWITNINFI